MTNLTSNNWMTPEWVEAGRYLYKLAAAALLNKQAPEKPDTVSWDYVYRLAMHNSIQSLAYYGALLAPEQPDQQVLNSWKKDLLFTVSRQTQMDQARERLASKMDEEEVDYLYLKGILLQNYYPKPGMRQMSDNDILYRFENEEDRNLGSKSQKKMREIMDSLGAKPISDDGIVDVYLFEPLSLFEMHRDFLGPDHKLFGYYHNLFDRAIIEDNERPHQLSLTPEEHYVLMLVHSYKHFSGGGCGPREIFDCHQFIQANGNTMDWSLVNQKLKETGLTEYEAMLRNLSDIIFDDKAASENELALLDWFMGCGTYGSRENAIRNTLQEMEKSGVSKTRAKAKYVWKRLFPDPAYLKTHFPFFYKHRSLIGFLLIYRTARGLISKRKELSTEFKQLNKI